MAYRFRDRATEWTSWVGIGLTAAAAVIPQIMPPDTWWVQAWEAVQTAFGVALVFIPHTAGTTAVESDAWSLLAAFSKQLPPAYAGPIQPLVQALASALAHATMNPNGPAPIPTPTPAPLPAPIPPPAPAPVPAVPTDVLTVPAAPVAPPPAVRPQPQPLVVDPSAALHPLS